MEAKAVVGFEEYTVTENGEIYSHKFGRKNRLILAKKRNGYYQVCMRKDGRTFHKSVHRIVAAAFLGESDLQVNHKDGNKQNNALSNLEYCTPSENANHAVELDLKPYGQRHGMAKLTNEQVLQVYSLKNSGQTRKEIGLRFGVTPNQVWNIWKGKSQSKITGEGAA